MMKKSYLDRNLHRRWNEIGASECADGRLVDERAVGAGINQEPDLDDRSIRLLGATAIQADHEAIVRSKNGTFNWKRRRSERAGTQIWSFRNFTELKAQN